MAARRWRACIGPEFLDFLASAWDEWTATGRDYDALPLDVAGPRASGRCGPERIDGQLGYYSFDAGTPITSGTWRAAEAGAKWP